MARHDLHKDLNLRMDLTGGGQGSASQDRRGRHRMPEIGGVAEKQARQPQAKRRDRVLLRGGDGKFPDPEPAGCRRRRGKRRASAAAGGGARPKQAEGRRWPL
uniref:Uncharacterized protein n=1 Tax=Oryza sativa subsp. japonica TaxID=39947 RepID=Q5SNM4_ORYSJ|nr:hypothetical protein [Oryza sativa Japonica Group]